MTMTPDLIAQILRYHYAERWPVGTISSQLSVHRESVIRVLTQAGASPIMPAQRPSGVTPFLPFIEQTLKQFPNLTASRLYAMVVERGYGGRPDHFRHLIARHRPRPTAQAYLRLRTLPGEQCQCDWAHFGHLQIGQAKRPLMAFVMVLSWSRRIFLRFFLGAHMENFLRGHVQAFESWGSLPRVTLYDNLKSAVLERKGQAIRFNPTLLALSAHYRFEPRPVAPARGNEYGVVTNMSRWVSIAPALPLKLTFLSRHNFWLQGAKEGHQIGLVAPMLLYSRIAFHFTCRQCPSLCFQIDLGVDIRRRQRNVPKPTAYRVDVDSGLEQQRGSRVSYDMRVHVLTSQ